MRVEVTYGGEKAVLENGVWHSENGQAEHELEKYTTNFAQTQHILDPSYWHPVPELGAVEYMEKQGILTIDKLELDPPPPEFSEL